MRIEHALSIRADARRPIRILVVGAGGTGSTIVMGLPYLDQALRVWGRFAGLDVLLMDADTVSETNCIRQPFSVSDIGQNKATVLVNRINLFWGMRWRAEPRDFDERTFERIQDTSIDFLIGCVDSRAARSVIARSLAKSNNRTAYWLDLGNNAASGQFVLGQPWNARNRRSAERLRTVNELYPENRTNVRQDSDVDICVLYTGAFFPDYSMSQGLDGPLLGYVDGTYTYAAFKNDVQAALIAYFGKESVTRGKKAFDVHANTYRIDADVVPAFEHRRFHGNPAFNWFDSGTQICPDAGSVIVNWPRQNYAKGVGKNDATGRRFKAVTRILKRLRNEMADEGYAAADPIPSYLIECLVWNVPNEAFGHSALKADVRWALAHLWNETRTHETCNEWGEINELKYLFWSGQPWTREQVKTFLQAAWDYIGFE